MCVIHYNYVYESLFSFFARTLFFFYEESVPYLGVNFPVSFHQDPLQYASSLDKKLTIIWFNIKTLFRTKLYRLINKLHSPSSIFILK